MAETKGREKELPKYSMAETKGTQREKELPTREGWSQPLVMYNNYWFRPHFLQNIMHLQNSFKARPDDTILVSNPKCGTTWLKALAFAITTRSRYDLDHHHPLLSQHPQQVVPFIEIRHGNNEDLEKLPSPRLLATHMPFSLLPESFAATSGCRMVYICREPKDALVSRWHFENKILAGHGKIDLEAAFSMFCEGFSPFGPFWDHCLEYWRESIAKPDKLLFLKYEDIMSEPVRYVVSLAKFLGVPFSEKELEDGVPEEVVRLCSFDNLSTLQTNQTGQVARTGNVVVDKSAFFRKGKVGDWVNHMSQEMGRKLDHIMEDKLRGSGLVL